MLSRNLTEASLLQTMDISLAGVNVRLEAPVRILDVLEATLRNVPRFPSTDRPQLTVSARPSDDVWEIHGATGSQKVLLSQSALPHVAGALISTAVSDAAARRNCSAMRATVIEKYGRAIAMIGDDWESAITVAAHLHGRGWKFLGGDNALLDPRTLEVHAFEKALYVNSSAVSHFPVKYRRAIEASPWYVTSQGISFYAVDPTGAAVGQAWTPSATLTGIVVVDGANAGHPAMQSLDENQLRSERFTGLAIDVNRVSCVDLKLGGFVETCDLIEHWFGSIQP